MAAVDICFYIIGVGVIGFLIYLARMLHRLIGNEDVNFQMIDSLMGQVSDLQTQVDSIERSLELQEDTANGTYDRVSMVLDSIEKPSNN